MPAVKARVAPVMRQSGDNATARSLFGNEFPKIDAPVAAPRMRG
jgi:hypothetical protein